MAKILITTTSFQDTPGKHHPILEKAGFEIERARGPLPEAEMLKLVGGFDAILCGDDAFTRPVLQKCLPRMKVLAKYGIGVDKIDLAAATDLKIPVTFCPGVNHVTVAEHTFGLMLAMTKNIPAQNEIVRGGGWKRSTGRELAGKTLGILGLGRIGKEVAKRARAFGMKLVAFDLYWDESFAKEHGVELLPCRDRAQDRLQQSVVAAGEVGQDVLVRPAFYFAGSLPYAGRGRPGKRKHLSPALGEHGGHGLHPRREGPCRHLTPPAPYASAPGAPGHAARAGAGTRPG